MSFNNVTLMGKLNAMPDFKQTQNGNHVCNMVVVTTGDYTDKAGTKHESSQWHNVEIWGRPAVNCNEYLNKGSMVFVDGSIDYSTYDKKDGSKGYRTKIKAKRVEFIREDQGMLGVDVDMDGIPMEQG